MTQSFAYEAQGQTGQPIRGTIEADALDHAERLLREMGLRIVQVQPQPRAKTRRALSGADFEVFNQQLSQMTAAGMPVERGLRLIAGDLKSGRLKKAIESIVAELERGQSLDAAFAAHRGQFPALYAQIVEAGIASSNLPAVLLSLGRRMDTTRRLRDELFRAIAYPMMVLLAVGLLLVFLSRYVFPQLIDAYLGFHSASIRHYSFKNWTVTNTGEPELPFITQFIAVSSCVLGPAVAIVALVLLVLPLLWQTLPNSMIARAIDAVMLRLPLVGPVLRKSLIARWLDALSVAVTAGLDLPRAIALAGNAVGSGPLEVDSQSLMTALQGGQPLDGAGAMRMLPSSIPPALQLAATQNNLPEALTAMAASYQQQADIRISVIPTILMPILMSVVALLIGAIMLALLAPLGRLLSWISG